MDVILLERISRLGQMGDTVKVKDGFARNFLLPQGKALRANEANRKKFEGQRAQLEAQNLERKNEAEAVATKLNGESFIVVRSAGETGQLYGSVSGRDVADIVNGAGGKLDRSMVVLDKPLKTLGVHPVKVRLHSEVVVSININIARSQDEAERQARGENVIASQYEEDRLADEEAAADMVAGGAGSHEVDFGADR